MKPAIFIPNDEQKALANKIAMECIDIIDSQTEDVYIKAFVLRSLIEGFEEAFNINIHDGTLATIGVNCSYKKDCTNRK